MPKMLHGSDGEKRSRVGLGVERDSEALFGSGAPIKPPWGGDAVWGLWGGGSGIPSLYLMMTHWFSQSISMFRYMLSVRA